MLNRITWDNCKLRANYPQIWFDQKASFFLSFCFDSIRFGRSIYYFRLWPAFHLFSSANGAKTVLKYEILNKSVFFCFCLACQKWSVRHNLLHTNREWRKACEMSATAMKGQWDIGRLCLGCTRSSTNRCTIKVANGWLLVVARWKQWLLLVAHVKLRPPIFAVPCPQFLAGSAIRMVIGQATTTDVDVPPVNCN